MGCQRCTCENGTWTLSCQPQPCPLPPACPAPGLVPVPAAPQANQCCPQYNCGEPGLMPTGPWLSAGGHRVGGTTKGDHTLPPPTKASAGDPPKDMLWGGWVCQEDGGSSARAGPEWPVPLGEPTLWVVGPAGGPWVQHWAGWGRARAEREPGPEGCLPARRSL